MSEIAIHTEEKALVPKLRFKEFDGEWKVTSLGCLLSFKNGLNSEKEKYGNGVKFINVLDIIENDFITYDRIIGSVEITDKEYEKNEVSYGDILFQRSSETREEVGQSNVYLDKERSAIFGGFVIRGKAKEIYEPMFMNYLLKTWLARKEITSKSGGSTRYNIGQETLSQVNINTTSLPEQQKIASFLSAVDEKIQQLTKKKELLEQYKKGVMQQLFKIPLSRGEDFVSSPKSEEYTKSGVCKNSSKHTPSPSQEGIYLRFKDENGKEYPEWEMKKLGVIGTTYNGLTGKTKENFGKGKPYIQYKQIFDSSKIDISKCDLVEINESESQTKVKYGDVFFTTSSETPNEIGTASVLLDEVEEMYLNSFCFGYKVKASILNPSFAQFLFRSSQFRKKMIPLAQGSTRYNIAKSSFLKLQIELPSIKEQQKIAAYLSSIDTKIKQVTNQITLTQTFKKGLLQQLFV